MKYVCLQYQGEALSQEEKDSLTAAYRAWGDAIQKSGKLIAAHGLEPAPTATTVRVRNGKTLTTDGPYAETKEKLSGIYIIEAKDLGDAIQFAATIPNARNGSVEVRAMWQQW